MPERADDEAGARAAADAAALEDELAWLVRLIDARFSRYFDRGGDGPAVSSEAAALDPPALDEATPYGGFVLHHGLAVAERAALILALAPILRPQILDVFHVRNSLYDRPFTEFGGRRGDGGFVPTGETLAFVLGGADLSERLAVRELFAAEHPFRTRAILAPPPAGLGDPLRTPLVLAEDVVARVLSGRPRRPSFGAEFPARAITTRQPWDDLVLPPATRRQLDEILAWIDHGDTLLGEWGMGDRLRPGLRCLFYGPPGTGKSMTACLLGARSGREVYKIDLSLVVSKYIGETEKNLARVFDQAEHQGWILFFDEADALFGKRSETRDAHDRYANQETAFLLQRLETFDGVSILASNLRDNIDAAFARRFESVIYFPLPRPQERRLLWERGFPAGIELDASLDLDAISQTPLAGGSIMNVIRYAALEALRRGERRIAAADVHAGIRRELLKEGKGG
ncbi:MAG: ATP-binding protein [Nannocystaceae bacterium]